MANFCLPKEYTQKFLSALKEGKLDPQKLAGMDSAARRAAFAEHVGDMNAKQVNALFESKLLLKNQQLGIVNWAKSVGGLKPAALKDLVTKMSKLDKVLNPEEEKAFLADLASKKLGMDVTLKETKGISDLTKKATEAGDKYKETGTLADRIQYGLRQQELHDYVESLKGTDKSLINIANLPKAIMTTLDFSALLRQGWGMMSQPEFYKAIGPMLKYAFNEKGYREMQAEVLTRPTYPTMKAAGLRVAALADKLSQREEAYMSTLVDKIPGIRGSERAYVGFLTRLRADTFDKYIKFAELRGEDVSKGSQATKDIANMINDFTGSGNIGKGDKYGSAVAPLNTVFFSPRKISATLNMLNPERYVNPKISATARRGALRNIIGSVGITAGLLSIAHLFGTKTETDSTSSDFGKVVIGNTHYDLTGGNGTYAILLSRLAQNKTKSSTTGKFYTLGTGYKPTTRGDLVIGKQSFLRNKLSPITSFVADWFYGGPKQGVPFKATDEILSRAYPLVIQDIQAILQKGGSASEAIAAFVADELGVGVNTY